MKIVTQSLKGMPVNSAFLYDCAQGILWVSIFPCQPSIFFRDFFLTFF